MSHYRWLILGLIWLANFSGALIQLSGAPVQLQLAAEFHLNAAEVATWINLPLLAIALFSIPAGLAVDYFSARKAIAFGLLLMALFGLARAAAPSFILLWVATFLFGVGQACILSGMPKAVSEWFPPAELGRAVGVYTSAAAIGVIAVFVLAPQLFAGHWRELFLTAGLVALVALAAWLGLGRSAPRGVSNSHSTDVWALWTHLRQLLVKKDVWILTAICCCTQIGIFSWLAFGFPFLVLARQSSEQLAGAVVSVTMVGFMVGALSTSSLSDWLGKRRPFLSVSGILACILFLLMPVLPLTVLWVGVFLIGVCFATLQVLLFSLPLELESVAPHQVGACEGIIISIGFFAGILVSPLLGSLLGDFASTTGSEFTLIFQLLAAVMLAAALLTSQLKEPRGARTPEPDRQ